MDNRSENFKKSVNEIEKRHKNIFTDGFAEMYEYPDLITRCTWTNENIIVSEKGLTENIIDEVIKAYRMFYVVQP